MTEVLKDSLILKTRKPHQCIGCNEIISVGGQARYTALIFDGEFQSNYFCLPCDNYISSLDFADQQEIADYGFTPGDIGDWRHESS